jgi:hypothetical protein
VNECDSVFTEAVFHELWYLIGDEMAVPVLEIRDDTGTLGEEVTN